ncbi:acetate kinase, partial [Candidatus Falkowbacteria bacterium]|nr:acetate kinase [Candidatus Falkowbacteria bacterium]
MSILVINSGSTSIKYKLFSDDDVEIKQGVLEGVTNHQIALKQVLREVGSLMDLRAVGHRVVHGGDKFIRPVVINDKILSEIEKFNHLAPLHNPYNLAGIKAAREYLPEAKQVAVFDTAFYAALPEAAKIYGLPLELTEKYNIRRFGFHGISHKFVMAEAAKQLKKDVNKINLITCH